VLEILSKPEFDQMCKIALESMRSGESIDELNIKQCPRKSRSDDRYRIAGGIDASRDLVSKRSALIEIEEGCRGR
jgi:hypothetical protein